MIMFRTQSFTVNVFFNVKSTIYVSEITAALPPMTIG